MRFIIRIGHSCNNACTFCHASQDTCVDDPLDRINRKVDQAKTQGARTIILSGGEPTLHPDLLAIAQHVHQQGLGLGLITNARRLADQSIAQSLIGFGLNYVYASLHAPLAALHNAIVQANAFDQSLQAIQWLATRVDHLWVNAVLTKGNLGYLDEFVALLEPLENAKIKFTLPQPKGSALSEFDDVVPQIDDAARTVAAVLSRSITRLPRHRFGHEGFPLCLLPGFEDLHDDLKSQGITHISNLTDEAFEAVDRELFVHDESCKNCRLRPSCPGIYRGYLEKNNVPVLHPMLPIQTNVAQIQAREEAAQEKRAWVRLTFACNNNCVFCLDKEIKDSRHRPLDVIQKEIIDARKSGATRLVLSGGEASIHPHFLPIIRFAKMAGFRWIQTITNGRMWSYPGFLERAINAGICEVTFSIHGDNSELHDRLVGVSGAFDQAFGSLKKALSKPDLVVSVDIVINGYNVDALPRIMQTFADIGVREFDLLHVVPFGGAWEKRDMGIFYDPAEHMPALNRAFAFSKRADMHIWLNRFPPQFAEGFEDLIQDPHKLLDEVRGRQSEFDRWMREGVPLPCRQPERCQLCYLNKLCAAASSIADSPARRLEVRSDIPAEIDAIAHRYPLCAIRARLSSPSVLAEEIRRGRSGWLYRGGSIVVTTRDALVEALELPGEFSIVVELTHHTGSALDELRSSDKRIVVRQPAYSSLRSHIEKDVDLVRWQNPQGYRLENIVPCLGGSHSFESWLDAEVLEVDGTVHALRFAAWFARDEYRCKSLRCNECVLNDGCQGMALNFVRAHGFASMQPISLGELDLRGKDVQLPAGAGAGAEPPEVSVDPGISS